MIKRKIEITGSLFYILGVITTIQLLSFSGITVFNIILILVAICPFLLGNKKIKVDKIFILSIVATLITILLSLNSTFLTTGFRKTAIVSGIIYLIICVVYLLMNTMPKYAGELVKGFKVSCALTLGWCCLQLILYYLAKLDLNTVVFSKVFRITDARSDYLNGSLIPSGFFYHRAVLVPSLLFLFFSTNNLYVLLLIIVIGCLTRSTALIMGLFLATVFKFWISNSRRLYQKTSKKKIIIALSIIIVSIVGGIIYSSQIVEIVKYVFERLSDVNTNKADNSSVVHFLYYKNLIPIMRKMDIKSILFGTGFSTSGLHYTKFNGQYFDMESWVVESDYINILLSQGVAGLTLWGYILGKIISISRKYKYFENIAFVLINAFVGIMYNIQFTWFIVIEFGMLVLTKNKIRIFDLKKE